jgi:hypothetical protein
MSGSAHIIHDQFYIAIEGKNETIWGQNKGTALLAEGVGPEILSPAG